MTGQDIRDFVQRYVADWERQNVSGLLARYTEDCRVVSPLFHTVAGRGQLEKSFRDLFRIFADWKVGIDELLIDREQGERAAMVFTAVATQRDELLGVPATGRRFENRGVFIFAFRDGLIESEVRMYDFTGMLVQLGILKTKIA